MGGLLIFRRRSSWLFSPCQTGARNTTEDYRRESIDYVTLNAQPRPRKNGSKKQVGQKITRVANNNANTITGRRACMSGRPHAQHQETANDTVHPSLRHATASPRDEESRENEDVSLFLDSFSASGMASKYPTSASETVTGAQSSPFSLPPRGGVKLDGRRREAEDAVVETVQATLAISKPLAQVNGNPSGGQRRWREPVREHWHTSCSCVPDTRVYMFPTMRRTTLL